MSVRVEKAGNRILLSSSSPTSLKSAIPGSYFRQDKIWSLPLDLTTCTLLRERYGKRLEIGPILWAWAKEERARRAAAGDLAAAADAELTVLPAVAPILAQAMSSRTYQRVGTRFVADSMGRDGRRRALIGDTVGLGKTAEAMGAVLESGVPGPYLVLAPKTSVNLAWTPEIRRWLPGDEIITIPDGKAKRDVILDNVSSRFIRATASLARTWVVLHHVAARTQTWWICHECGSKTKYRAGKIDMLDCDHEKVTRTKVEHEHVFPQLFGIRWGAVIVDESDQMLIRLTGTPNLVRRGAEMLRDLVPSGGVRIAMSGTPFRSKPHQIWSTLNWLDPIRFSAKWSFVQKYWETVSGDYGGMTIGEMKGGREELLKDELSDIMIRRERKHVRSDLPARNYAGVELLPGDETTPKGIWLPMEGKQLKAYRDIEKIGTATIEGGDLSPSGVLAEMTRMRQFATSEGRMVNGEFEPMAAGNKYEWLLAFMQELGFPHDPASKLVIGSQSTKLLNAFRIGIEHEFSTKRQHLLTGMVTGEQSQRQREGFVDAFEDADSGLDLILVNTKAGGSAITLDQADVMVVLDETYVDDDQEQLEGRIDNRNPERKIVPRTYYYPRSLASIEQHIAQANLDAKRAGRKLLDGGAKALAKKVLGR